MIPCTTCNECLWDHLHGLLEPDQERDVEAHVAQCSSCQQALEAVRADCTTLAAAARLDVAIPLFVAPTGADAESTPSLIFRARNAVGQRWSWAAAAAILLACAAPYGFYRYGLHQGERAQALARDEMLASRTERQHLRDQLQVQQTALTGDLQSKHLRLLVNGPAAYDPQVENRFKVRVADLAGKAAPARVSARIRDAKDNVLLEKVVKVDGDTLLSLPPTKAPDEAVLRVEFVADTPEGPETVAHTLASKGPRFATHLALEKASYRPGDTARFRSVTLVRGTLRPVDAPLAILYELKGPDGKQIASLSGLTREEGIGAGALVLPSEAKPGLYKITVVDAGGRFPPVSRSFRVSPKEGSSQPTSQAISKIDFFPEGGVLAAGVPTRIYFQAHGADGLPVALEGTVVDNSGHEVAAVQSVDLRDKSSLLGSHGAFLLTPKAGEKYLLRLRNAADKDTKHALPPVVAKGLGLALDTPVARAGERIRATIYANLDEPADMTVGLFFRGSLTAHETRRIRPGVNQISLLPPDGVSGVYRLAVFPVQTGVQMPLAQRLGYYRDGSSLPIAWTTSNEKDGRVVALRAGETDRREKTWFSVSVVPADEPGAVEQSAGEEFQAGLELAQELPQLGIPEHLGSWLRDEPAAVEALGNYLGMLKINALPGGRGANPVLAVADPSRLPPDAVALLCMDNRDQVSKKYVAALSSGLAALQAKSWDLDRLQSQHEEEAQKRALAAAQSLDAYRARALFWARTALMVAAALCFAAGALGFVVAVSRWLQTGIAWRSGLVGSMAALAACLALLLVPASAPEDSQRVAALAPFPAMAASLPDGQEDLRNHIVARAEQPRLEHPVMIAGTARPNGKAQVFDRTTPLPVLAYRDKTIWEPAIVAADGACSIKLDVPPGKLGYILRVDAFTASGRLGSTVALVK